VVTETLVEPLKEHGRRLIEQYELDGHSVAAAFWVKTAVDGSWYLYLVIDDFAAKGPNISYRTLYSSWSKLENPWVQFAEIKLIDKNDPVAQSVHRIIMKYGNDLATSLQIPVVLGNSTFDELYIYPQK
jgi:hypothetical protein